MTEWDKLWENTGIMFDDYWLKEVKAEGDKLQQENEKLKYIENVLREINNSDLGITISIDTGLWKCDYCGVEFDSNTYRWHIPMDYGCLTRYKESKQKLEAIHQYVIGMYPDDDVGRVKNELLEVLGG